MHEFLIQPNRSLSSNGRRLFLVTMALVMAAITIRLATLGLWLVAPFMLLDLVLLVLAFRWVAGRCAIQERVQVDHEALSIYHSEAKRERSWQFPLYWVQVDLRLPAHPAHGSRLLIGSHGQWVELAGFLTNDERATLAEAIRSAIVKTLAVSTSAKLSPSEAV